VVSEEQQRAIDVRRHYVGRFFLRGMNIREIHAGLASMTATDPATGGKHGGKHPVCVNPDTGQPWCMATIGLDVQAVQGQWDAGVAHEIEARRARLDAHFAEMRRIAYATNDMVALDKALRQEREMFGLDAPKRSEVTHEEKTAAVVPNKDNRFLDVALDLRARFVGPPK